MRTVFFGTPDLAVPIVDAVHARHGVVAVVCQPDRPKGRSGRPAPPPVKVWAVERGIPVLQPETPNTEAFVAELRELRPDMCAVAAYGRLVRQVLLDIPPLGWLNVHPSLLPRWRGPSPIQTSILEGATETGVTIMRMTLEMDSGELLEQRRTPVFPEETAEELTRRLAAMAAEMMPAAMDRVLDGTAVFTPQDPERVTYCKMFRKSHGFIRWAGPAWRIHNRVRACVPWPAAQTLYNGQVCRILATRVEAADGSAAPGTVTGVERDRILVATGEGALAVLRFQAPGKKPLDMADFLRGHAIRPGERFEDIQDAD